MKRGRAGATWCAIAAIAIAAGACHAKTDASDDGASSPSRVADAPPTGDSTSTPDATSSAAPAPPTAATVPGPTASSGPFYDPTPLLASLRPSAGAPDALAKAAGVRDLSELPLYDLALRLSDSLDSFELVETVSWTNLAAAPESELVLRLYADASDAGPPPVTFVGGECVAGTCAVKLEGKSTIVVTPGAPVAPGDRLRVKLRLGGRLEPIDSSRTTILAQGIEQIGMLGGGESPSYGLLAKGDDISSLANFYAVVAPHREGRWEREDASTMGDLGSDEIAHVHAIVDAPAAAKIATSGVAVKDGVMNGRRVEEIEAGLVRDFAVIASPSLEVATRDVGGVTVRSWFLPAERNAGERVLDAAARALEIYEKRFGAYPYADLDVCEAALVGGAGGVEFAGLVTVASMLYRPALPTDGLLGQMFTLLRPPQRGGGDPIERMVGKMLEFTTAHEVAHQWWHGLVGNDSRVHPYVDESLAQYSAIQYLEDRYGKERAKEDASMNVAMNYAAMRMMGRADGTVDRAVADFGDMVSYAGIVYGKAPYLWLALRAEVGDEKFFEGMRSYVNENRMRIAKPRALVDALAGAVPAKSARVREIAKRWLDETHGDDDVGTSSLMEMLAPELGLDPKALDPELMSLLMGGAGGKPGPNGPPVDDMLDRLLHDGANP